MRVNDGTGRLGPPMDKGPATAPGDRAYSILAGDLNGDGHVDLVYAHSPQYPAVAVAVQLGDGAGGFAPRVDYRIAGLGYPGLAIADLDGDGDDDIVAFVAEYGQPGEIDALMNSGAGTFTPTVKYRNTGDEGELAAADLDGDGRAEVVVSMYEDDSVYVFWNRGNGDLMTPAKVPAGVRPAYRVDR